MTKRLERSRTLFDARGQSLIEFALILPLAIVLVLGVVELGYALLDSHIVTKLSREGSNLISRDTTLLDAANAMKNMSTRPVNLNGSSSKLIFSVIRRGAISGTTNYNQNILYQRYEIGGFSASSVLATAGSAAPGPAPDYIFPNSDSNASLRVTNLPANLLVVPGGMIYVTEVYTRHTLITPFNNLGFSIPQTLYSIAYF